MPRLVADENFNNDLIRGALRRQPLVDIVRIQDVGLRGADDPSVLAWAAQEHRALLTHDVTTLTNHAYTRISAGLSMPGIFAVANNAPPRVIIDDILLLAEGSLEGEWEGTIQYLPHGTPRGATATSRRHRGMRPGGLSSA